MSQVIDDTEAKRRIAGNVNRLLAEQGKSRYWLAKITGEYESRIANVCNAANLCNAGLLARIAEALGVSTNELYEPIRGKSRKRRKIA